MSPIKPNKTRTPRWQHKCPGCKRVIYWNWVYCKACSTEEPSRKRFRLDTRKNTSYRPQFLPGIQNTMNHVFIVGNGAIMCIECGRTLDKKRHRCFSKIEEALRTKNTMLCLKCLKNHPMHAFPLVPRKRKHIRTRVCAGCLHGSKLVIATVKERK